VADSCATGVGWTTDFEMSDDFLFKRNSLSQKPITAGLVRRPSETPHCANEMPGKTARTGRLAQKKRMFSGSFRAFSIEVVGQYGSHGDKIYLPQKVFQEVTILYRLEFPLFFKLSNRFGHGEVEEKGEEGWENADSQPPTVYCGIREFSAPKDVCYLPAHVMRTLNIEEGGNVTVESVQVAAMAQWVQFEAKDQGLIEMLGQLGVCVCVCVCACVCVRVCVLGLFINTSARCSHSCMIQVVPSTSWRTSCLSTRCYLRGRLL
jgi:hypothetical protein